MTPLVLGPELIGLVLGPLLIFAVLFVAYKLYQGAFEFQKGRTE